MKKLFFFAALSHFIAISCTSPDKEEVQNEPTTSCEGFSIEVTNWTNNNNAIVNTEGGKSPITYTWSTGETTSTIGKKEGNLEPGTYTVVAKDAKGCQQTASIVIETALVSIKTEVSCIGSNLIHLKNVISNDAGSEITERGVCYALEPNPTIANSKIVSENAYSNYESKIEGLALGTTYYLRGYVITAAGTSYSNQVKVSTRSEVSPYSIGQVFQGGIIAHINCDGISGFILNTTYKYEKDTWIIAKQKCEKWTTNGYSDWYLPSYKQLYKIYNNLHKTNIYTLKTGNTIYDNYWTSFTKDNSNVCGNKEANYINFSNGETEALSVCYNIRFVAIRDF
ncbi:MAG: DUF1566 domain-containing protein [Flavobacteriaceae bacterium]|nr:DUF1566 domain-containing protein [Flavobacteriaceae bacterium]